MSGCAGLLVGAGGGQPLPKVQWMSQTPFPPSIPNLDDLDVPCPTVGQFPSPPPGIPRCFPPPGLGEEPETVSDGTAAMLEFTRNSITKAIAMEDPQLPSSYLPLAPPGLDDDYAPPVATSPLPLLLGRAKQNYGYAKSMEKETKASSASPKFGASLPLQPSAHQPNVSKSVSPQSLEGCDNLEKDCMESTHCRQQLMAVLSHLQSISSQHGAPACETWPQSLPQGLRQEPIPSWSPVPQVLSTAAPPRLHKAPSHPTPTQTLPLVLSVAAAGFFSGLPAATTIAAALSSPAHRLQVPNRQQLQGHRDVPVQETFGQIEFGPADVGAGIGDFRKLRSMVSDSRDRHYTSCAPTLPPDVSPNHIGKESYSLGLEPEIDCHDRNSHAFPNEVESKNGRPYACKFVFVGIDLDRDKEFDLVPRLIGRGGENMRRIAQRCDGKVRIRGRGSGHKELQKGNKVAREADVPLQIALSCKDRRSFVDGTQILVDFLGGMCIHFERYCKRHRIQPVPTLYTIIGDR